MSRKFAHKLVTEIAAQIAAAAYEELAKDNIFYKANPNMRRWVNKHWTLFIKDARASMAKMLADPKWPEPQKKLILDALLMDRTLPAGGGTAITGNMVH